MSWFETDFTYWIIERKINDWWKTNILV